MTFPSADFTPVAPPVDGLSLAFTAARRRRNGKAAVSAFGGAVAIVSVLSMLAPSGQTLVQQPAPPAHGSLTTGSVSTSHTTPVTSPVLRAPAPQDAAATGRTSPSTRDLSPAATHPAGAARPAYAPVGDRCARGHWVTCSRLRTSLAGGGGHAEVGACPSEVAVSAGYSVPLDIPAPTTGERDVSVGTGSCDS